MLYQASVLHRVRRPFFISSVSAGFPSPADDFIEGSLDLNQHLIGHPQATFFLRVSGDSMTGAGIFPGDLLIVDRSLTPAHNDIVIAVVHNELTVKRLVRCGARHVLRPENPAYKEIPLPEDAEIWGVVSHTIHGFR
ncbi:MAG: LexA family protein [Parvibaculales bacterium]